MYQSFKDASIAKKLSSRISDGECYTFPLHQIYLEDGRFQQTRSGPNWQGGLLTMATCKHFLRSTKTPEQWVGKYMAGFTPKINGSNYLLFLAKIEHAFECNFELGRFILDNYPSVYDSKSTASNDRGDIFHAKKSNLKGNAVYDRTKYVVTPTHVRTELKNGNPKWWSDIDYKGPSGRRPAVLLFEEGYHLFDKPVYEAVRPLYRSGYRCSVKELIEQYIRKV